MQYSEEQIADIKSREEKGLQALKELHLTPAAVLGKHNIGNDTFADKVQPYLQDTLYKEKKEPTSAVAPEGSVKNDPA